ncbi:hypothetical protein CcaverHIS002_0705030 [Cutaneotrichosporon cavernicola]|uniref:HD domain-containing protein n=1 Tax=Cutaneotrichosporon cavernicola TaxID=279322 RepID=A0AA48LAE4_9TREE|nr:uncharacterized protein CcaverHIS019_0705090 [Cutaneotrichosporon cavernicola]BEI87157.1 hypothetical protein CcaverHIS002_0705030 [Cutaneotrichosporon cavernicola]BEI94928.1 hypothetical protein CcaverHIS019_0705090 [Cutaneotrichosporon cavernicola]BEJ02703.1 hypothetical protein CcaverHIS631_0704980 [Cutaneotrichosporon cavernicola]BEJ10457.1 hypothetical protein CcaverHIS641_0704920 [Cutaneotrichosporon cavernicola]
MSVARLEAIVKEHMKAYDPSHDCAHVERGRRVALKLAPPGVNVLVVELAALMHDLNDFKYATSTPLAQIAADNLGPDVTEGEVAQVLRIVPSVSYSKEMELRAAGEWT